MKKILLAAAAAFALSAASYAAETIDGVWGVNFGASVADANAVMTGQNGARLLCEYSYLPGYHEAFYAVDFFGRQGHLLLRFSKKGLFLARFAFARKGDLERAKKAAASRNQNSEKKYAAFTGHYNELSAMLTSKYGAPTEQLEESGVVSGVRWSEGVFSRQSITLYENRSLTQSDTVLSYEDSGRK